MAVNLYVQPEVLLLGVDTWTKGIRDGIVEEHGPEIFRGSNSCIISPVIGDHWFGYF